MLTRQRITVRVKSLSCLTLDLTLEGPYIIFAIYMHSNEIHKVAALIVY